MVCNVNGTGPKGTVTHAPIVIRAIANPQNATDSDRLSVCFFCMNETFPRFEGCTFTTCSPLTNALALYHAIVTNGTPNCQQIEKPPITGGFMHNYKSLRHSVRQMANVFEFYSSGLASIASAKYSFTGCSPTSFRSSSPMCQHWVFGSPSTLSATKTGSLPALRCSV